MSQIKDLTVTIEIDTSAFDAALRRLSDTLDLFFPLARRFELMRRRHRSRVVTRRKQRRSW